MITVDAIKKSSEMDQIPLKWVGMEKVMLPILFDWNDGKSNTKTSLNLIAQFDIFVNLVNPSKGIHMSRLYELLMLHTQTETLTLAGVRQLLASFIPSQNGLSSEAKISIAFSMPVMAQTLKSEKFYLKTVPLAFDFILANGAVKTEMKFKMDYSSTCPQSAALAHQLTIHEFEKQNSSMTAVELTEWYAQRGFVATPHAQRSELNLTGQVSSEFELHDFAKFFLELEQCIGTSTQGLVKRDDEQEFARLNASNLMFCEDAARKLMVFLKHSSWLVSGHGKVSHLESLHSHNAVAYFDF
jgi:GTP cyclohydrolase I